MVVVPSAQRRLLPPGSTSRGGDGVADGEGGSGDVLAARMAVFLYSYGDIVAVWRDS